jgi:hypothetical protein
MARFREISQLYTFERFRLGTRKVWRRREPRDPAELVGYGLRRGETVRLAFARIRQSDGSLARGGLGRQEGTFGIVFLSAWTGDGDRQPGGRGQHLSRPNFASLPRGPSIQATMDESDVLIGKAQTSALHLGVVVGVPAGLHDATRCVLVDTLEDMDDLVRQQVSQETRESGRFHCLQHAIVEQNNPCSLEWKRTGKRAGMQISRGRQRDADKDTVIAGATGTLVIPPFDPDVRLLEELRRGALRSIENRRVRFGIHADRHHRLGHLGLEYSRAT